MGLVAPKTGIKGAKSPLYLLQTHIFTRNHCHPVGGSPVSLGMDVVTPLAWEEWDQALQQHPDKDFRAYIMSGIRYGFRLGFNYGARCRPVNRNMKSVVEHTEKE